MLRPALAIAPNAVDKDGRFNIVARTGVGEKVVEHVTTHPLPLPQVMVGVDDRQSWLDRLLRSRAQPAVIPDHGAHDTVPDDKFATLC